jgi:hypothetical protein
MDVTTVPCVESTVNEEATGPAGTAETAAEDVPAAVEPEVTVTAFERVVSIEVPVTTIEVTAPKDVTVDTNQETHDDAAQEVPTPKGADDNIHVTPAGDAAAAAAAGQLASGAQVSSAGGCQGFCAEGGNSTVRYHLVVLMDCSRSCADCFKKKYCVRTGRNSHLQKALCASG